MEKKICPECKRARPYLDANGICFACNKMLKDKFHTVVVHKNPVGRPYRGN